AAYAIPDARASDQAYFRQLVQYQLEAVERYMTYGDSRGWFTEPYLAVGMNPQDSSHHSRYNIVLSTTPAGGSTILSVVGDNSGIPGVDDHGLLTGDFVDLSGFSGDGAPLNGGHVGPVARISETQFSVPVQTAGSTAGQGQWLATTAPLFAFWRTHVAAW